MKPRTRVSKATAAKLKERNRTKPTTGDNLKPAQCPLNMKINSEKQLAPSTIQTKNLAADGPVYHVKGSQGAGLILFEEKNALLLVALATGEGFSLSPAAALEVASLLESWAQSKLGDYFALAE